MLPEIARVVFVKIIRLINEILQTFCNRSSDCLGIVGLEIITQPNFYLIINNQVVENCFIRCK